MQNLIDVSTEKKREITKKAKEAEEYLRGLSDPEILPHSRTHEMRYGDEILKNFSYILDKKILDKLVDINQKKSQKSDIENPENRDRFDITQSDNSDQINLLVNTLKGDEKILRQFINARSRINHMTYGICFKARTLMSITELLAQPGRTYSVKIKKQEQQEMEQKVLA